MGKSNQKYYLGRFHLQQSDGLQDRSMTEVPGEESKGEEERESEREREGERIYVYVVMAQYKQQSQLAWPVLLLFLFCYLRFLLVISFPSKSCCRRSTYNLLDLAK